MEEVEDEDHHSCNVSPSNASQLIESADGSEDDDIGIVSGTRARALSVININNDSSEEVSEVEETDKAERGMICGSISK